MKKRLAAFLLCIVTLTVLFSVCALAQETYAVEYDTRGGNVNISSQTKKQGVDLYLSMIIPTKKGYTFGGWATETDGVAEYYAGAIYKQDADITLYAVWIDNVPEKAEVSLEYDILKTGEMIKLSWNKAERADQYEIYIYKKDTDYLVYAATALVATSENIARLDEGEYDVYIASVNTKSSDENHVRALSDKVCLYVKGKDFVPEIVLTIDSKQASVFGKEAENDVAPIIRNDRTMLPARFIAENLGAQVSWDPDMECVTITKNKKELKIYIGLDVAFVDGEEVELDSPAFIENDRTYTPVRFICEALGAKVSWNEELRQVTVKYGKG